GLTNLDATYSGLHVLDGCLDGVHTCLGFDGNDGTSDRLVNVDLVAGTTYYIVISTWASPYSVGYTLTLEEVGCPAPSYISYSGVSTSSADVSWSNLYGASEWQIEFGPAGYTPGTGTSYFPTTESQTISP